MFKKLTIFVFLSLMCALAPTWAQTAPDLLAYDIPADAIKKRFTHPRLTVYHYFQRNPDGTPGDLVGIEYFHDDITIEGDEKLIKRETYKVDPTKILVPNRLHGVTREWYLDGQLKSEQPYRMHIMDGLFRHWDEQGNLVGQYQINNGNGVRKIYDSEGQLLREEHYKNNRQDGFKFEFYPYSTYVFASLKDGKYQGWGINFLGKRVVSMRFFGADERVDGPDIRFDLRNKEQKKNPDLGFGFSYGGEIRKWYINGQEVSEKEYG